MILCSVSKARSSGDGDGDVIKALALLCHAKTVRTNGDFIIGLYSMFFAYFSFVPPPSVANIHRQTRSFRGRA